MYFDSNKNNIKKKVSIFWKGVNGYLNKTQLKSSPSMIKTECAVLTDPKEIANEFNEYFVQVAPSLVDKLPKTSKQFFDYLGPQTNNSFFVEPTSPEEIHDLINQLDPKKSKDVYNFPIDIIKKIKNVIADPLSMIVNSSFSNGIFPDKLKYAKVLPIHKSGPKFKTNNYRPISVLPLFDRIIEKLMYTRLNSFLEKK